MKDLWRMMRKEFSTGFLIGLICMMLITILILLFYGNIMLGVVVGLSILVTLSISAVVGLIFPLVLNKLKFDPAIASGPFITTINDIIGLMIYFSIATILMNYL
ncbi:magnesium transporter [Oceanobacillus sp. APA_J-5(13-2)]|nr:magnesium transporter [Oceanobacillus alkalisoli]MCG5102499.1 magnesium transporter [Oceanobacillus alkalisoli]